MKLIVAAVGRLKSGPERSLCERYAERLQTMGRALGVTGVQSLEISESAQRRPEDRKREEAHALTTALPEGAVVLAFDERGKSLSSEEFAALVQTIREAAPPALALVIGGPDGFDADFRARARGVVAFGRLTMPHQLVRALVYEQAYRAATIIAGHPYHRV